MSRATFPKNGTLLEWSEKQQAFFYNHVTDGQSHSELYKNGLEVVFASESYREVSLVTNTIEALIKPKGSIGYDQKLTARQISQLIKKITAFSAKHQKYASKNKK